MVFAWPSGPTMGASSGILPLLASAKQISPGIMKRYTGKSLRKAAKMEPRRASVSFLAPSARCTMYWSVHQYQRPTIGAQKSIPNHGKLSLKYQASLTTAPEALVSSTGAQVLCTPAGIIGSHRLNMSDPHQARSSLHPPSLC